MRLRATVVIRNAAMTEARKRLRLSQAQLGKKAKCSLPMVIRFERLNFSKGRRETLEDIGIRLAVALGISTDEVVNLDLLDARFKFPEMVSIAKIDANKLLAPRQMPSLMDTIQDGALKKALDTLTVREREILEFRFGLNGEKPLTLLEAGQKFGVTKERVRRLEMRAMEKLREPAKGLCSWRYSIPSEQTTLKDEFQRGA